MGSFFSALKIQYPATLTIDEQLKKIMDFCLVYIFVQNP